MANPLQMKIATFRSKAANWLIGKLLDSPISKQFEKLLVWLGHSIPYNLPARSAITNQLARRNSGYRQAIINKKIRMVVTGFEGVGLYLLGCIPDEKPTTFLLKRFLKEGYSFFDIGANYGFYSFLAASICGSKGLIVAFEPQPVLVECLNKTITLNGLTSFVKVEQKAVTNTSGGSVTLYFSKDKEKHTGIPSLFLHEWLDPQSAIEVKGITLDDYVIEENIKRIDLIKIDIEGAEYLALQGMLYILQQIRPQILILEFMGATMLIPDISSKPLHSNTETTNFDKIVILLKSVGYQPRKIQKNGKLGEIIPDLYFNNLGQTENIAFCLPELNSLRVDLFV